jgi:orotate phosphoribosyltransferase
MSETMPDYRTPLLIILATHSFKLGDFTLASGQKSDYYIDCRTTTLHAEGGRLAGLILYDIIRERFPHAAAVGGLTMGADPLVSNTASASAWHHHEHHHRPPYDNELVHGFLVRKTAKDHGTGRRIEGFHQIGAHVIIVDDVCTTGGSTIDAIEATQQAGMNVAGVLCLVDREQGGRQNIQAKLPHAPFISVFTANDVRAAHVALNKS